VGCGLALFGGVRRVICVCVGISAVGRRFVVFIVGLGMLPFSFGGRGVVEGMGCPACA
jgi:hypothetical protein